MVTLLILHLKYAAALWMGHFLRCSKCWGSGLVIGLLKNVRCPTWWPHVATVKE